MKKVILIMCIGFAIITSSCARGYQIIKETPLHNSLSNYDTVIVGWLDLGPQKWARYGYTAGDSYKWAALIKTMNTNTLPEALKRYLYNKTLIINGVKVQAGPPQRKTVRVVFYNADYVQRTNSASQVMFGSFAGYDTLEVIVALLDGQTGRALYRGTVSVLATGGSYSSYAFDGRVNNAIYNLASFIADKVN